MLNVGTTTVSGSAPFVTPNMLVPGLFIAVEAMVADPEPAILIVGEVDVPEGFVISNPNV